MSKKNALRSGGGLHLIPGEDGVTEVLLKDPDEFRR
jgi:hypothetical protein